MRQRNRGKNFYKLFGFIDILGTKDRSGTILIERAIAVWFSARQEGTWPKSVFGPSHELPWKWLLLFCRRTEVVLANTSSRSRSCWPCCA
ncbi:MAG: hypothetical protein HYS38_09925 [Acidobacteria bacterium]|nr:hypothetical protein [Acidobacteriota bacterium]